MGIVNIDIHHVKKISVDKPKLLTTELGYVSHIIIIAQDGSKTEITLFSEYKENLKI